VFAIAPVATPASVAYVGVASGFALAPIATSASVAYVGVASGFALAPVATPVSVAYAAVASLAFACVAFVDDAFADVAFSGVATIDAASAGIGSTDGHSIDAASAGIGSTDGHSIDAASAGIDSTDGGSTDDAPTGHGLFKAGQASDAAADGRQITNPVRGTLVAFPGVVGQTRRSEPLPTTLFNEPCTRLAQRRRELLATALQLLKGRVDSKESPHSQVVDDVQFHQRHHNESKTKIQAL
jgi:hypothetical protein